MTVGVRLFNSMRISCVILAFVLLFSFSFCAFADSYADINNDSFVDIRDVIAMKKLIINRKHYEALDDVDVVDNSAGRDYNAVDLANLVGYIIGSVDSFSPYDSMDEL